MKSAGRTGRSPGEATEKGPGITGAKLSELRCYRPELWKTDRLPGQSGRVELPQRTQRLGYVAIAYVRAVRLVDRMNLNVRCEIETNCCNIGYWMAPVAGDLRRPPFWHIDAVRGPSTHQLAAFFVAAVDRPRMSPRLWPVMYPAWTISAATAIVPSALVCSLPSRPWKWRWRPSPRITLEVVRASVLDGRRQDGPFLRQSSTHLHCSGTETPARGNHPHPAPLRSGRGLAEQHQMKR